MVKVRSEALVQQVFDAWNAQDVEATVGCYTEDCLYLDPNTRGHVEGRSALRRYLTRLFDRWQMHWEAREAFPLEDRQSGAYLWRATLRLKDGGPQVEVEGMDLVVMRGDLIHRNEVYFDRVLLAPALGMASLQQ